MSLPCLAGLRLVSTDSAEPQPSPSRRKRRPDGALPGPVSQREAVFLDGVARHLTNTTRVAALVKQDNFVVSAVPGRYAVYAMKFSDAVTVPFMDGEAAVTELVELIQEEFASKTQYPASGDKRCGSFNCFFRRDLKDNDEVDMAIRALFLAMFPPERELLYFFKAVSVRAPRQNNDGFSDELTVAAADELALTLLLAERSLAPPVFFAVPVTVVDTFGSPAFSGFLYVGEAGWVDLKRFAVTIHDELESTDQLPLALADFSKTLLDAFRSLSNERVLLFDVKPSNMVARKAPGIGRFEVRFIDFGADFSVSATQPDTDETSSDCVFVVNSLLFINAALGTLRSDQLLLGALALDVVATWRALKRVGRLSAFCELLDQDRGFAGGSKLLGGGFLVDIEGMHHRDNLGDASGSEFLSHLRETFYTRLLQYYYYDLVEHREASTEFYMDAIVARLEALLSLPQADVEAAIEAKNLPFL